MHVSGLLAPLPLSKVYSAITGSGSEMISANSFNTLRCSLVWTHSNCLDALSPSSKSLFINPFSFWRPSKSKLVLHMSSINVSLTPLLKQHSTAVSSLLALYTTKKHNKLKHCSQIQLHTTHTTHTHAPPKVQPRHKEINTTKCHFITSHENTSLSDKQ